MSHKGWSGAANVMIASMEKSLENAVNIVVFHLYWLELHKDDGEMQMAMYMDFLPKATNFINAVSAQTGDKEAQTVLTEALESVFMDMSPNLDNFDSLTRDVHHVNTEEYNIIWGRNRNRFYEGSYEQRLGALLALSTEMTSQTVPLGSAAVLAYRTLIMNKQANQKARMSKVGEDNTSVEELRQILIKKLNKNRGGLIYLFGDDDDCQKHVNQYFPLSLMGDRSVWGHYQLMIPKGDFRKICMHLFKTGEKIEITPMGSDIWICSADNTNNPMASGYKAIDGQTVTINPTLIGDLNKKIIMATNMNLTSQCNLIFNIIKA